MGHRNTVRGNCKWDYGFVRYTTRLDRIRFHMGSDSVRSRKLCSVRSQSSPNIRVYSWVEFQNIQRDRNKKLVRQTRGKRCWVHRAKVRRVSRVLL